MDSEAIPEIARTNEISDEDIVRRVIGGEVDLFELLMRRYNRRLFRAARAITGDASEAEDVMQDAYINAFTHLRQFEGRAKFATWLTRIAVHEASARARQNGRLLSFDAEEEENMVSSVPDAEHDFLAKALGEILEAAIDRLAPKYRAVFMLCGVEGMSARETAESLDITEEAVRVRLYRARAFLRKTIYAQTGAATAEAFAFAGVRCDRVVRNVLEKLSGSEPDNF
jgi:RNA polymerase sigma-70 factor (ECF subfamily)